MNKIYQNKPDVSKNRVSRRLGGFTLIELLVVVLIIGILAGVALPQYQNAVNKSRAIGLLSNMKTIRQAAEAYKMATGSYPMDFTQVDISFPGQVLGTAEGVENSSITLPDGSYYAFDIDGYIQGSNSAANFNYWYDVSKWGVKQGCFMLRAGSEKTKRLGKSMGTFTQKNSFNEDVYEICF